MSRCPLCHERLEVSFKAHGYPICRCAACGHLTAAIEIDRAAHVESTYSDQYFSGGGAGYTDYLAEGELLRERGRGYAKLLQPHIPRPGWMLDVGAAAGFLLKGYQDEGWQGFGVEPNAQMAEVARSSNGVQVACSAFEDYQAPRSFDLVSMIQVIAHFLDPAAAMAQAASLLAPCGFVLIESWDRESYAAKLFGHNWHEYSPPSVVQWFSKDGLNSLAGEHGLKLVATGRPQRSIQAGHAASLLRYKLNGSLAGKVAGPLLGLVPQGLKLPYPGDDLFWALYRA